MTEKDIKSALQKYQPQLDNEYQKNLQIAKYTNLSDIEKSNFLQHSAIVQNHICFLIDGNKQQNFEDSRLQYFMIHLMDQKIDQNFYTIVYLMNYENGGYELDRFRKILKRLPLKYYLRLKQMYIYQASLIIRTKLWIQRSKRYKLWQKKTTYIDDEEKLLNVQNFSAQWIKLVPEKQQDHYQQIEQQKLQQPTIGPYGMNLEQQKLNQYGIPIILDYLLSYFVVNADRFLRPDVFRKQGSIEEETQLFELLNAERYESLNVVEDVRIVCTMIKRFFTALPEPLITQNLLLMICNYIPKLNQKDELSFLEEIFSKLPTKNRILLSLMTSFLLTVGNYADFNHMNMGNLAIVFAPCFLRVQATDLSSIEQIGLTVKFLRILFDNFDKMFPEFTFKLFLSSKMGQTSSSTSSNSSTGPDTNSKTQMLSSSEDEIQSDLQLQK